jgi:HlyD family secretion protein
MKHLRSPLAIAAVAVAFAALAGCGSRDADNSYNSAQVTRGDLLQYVTASGTLSAVVSVDVGSQVSGKVSALNVDFNDHVKKGQLIAEIDPSVYQAALRQAEGDLASAEANLVLKKQNLERKKILVPQKAASQLDLDQATAEVAQAEATVIIKRAALDSARANLSYCKITSPIDGIVISRKVDAGQTLVAAMSTPVLFTIARDITKMHISAPVSEADIGLVKVDQTLKFNVDAFPEEEFTGKVIQVRKAPTTTSNVVTYEVVIDVDNPEEKLFPGMTADVSILVAEHRNALKVTNAALRYAPPATATYEGTLPSKLGNGERLAYSLTADGKTLKPLIVKAGIADGVDTEVLAGADEGAALVISTRIGGARAGGFGGGPPDGDGFGP